MPALDGRKRVVIDRLDPEIDGGLYPAKRAVGDTMVVEADIVCDGHDSLSAELHFRPTGEKRWSSVPMELLVNDRWRAEFALHELGTMEYTVRAWVDHFKTWRHDLGKRLDAAQDISVDLLYGAQLAEATAARAKGLEKKQLKAWAAELADEAIDSEERLELALSDRFASLMVLYPDAGLFVDYGKVLRVQVDPEYARTSAWYEMFPRSAGVPPLAHGTFRSCIERLDYVGRMGFDVLYLPPIHPIGKTMRKGPNNTLEPGPDDVGSPWAIGAAEGGHKAIHPELGTLEDFRELVEAARARGIEVALDIALQCSPDHPYAKEHPEWFKHRPDGTIQYAENPPKKYQDIYPFDFECEAWEALWAELKSIFDYWIGQGVRIFRVDNPHTKPFRFWDWLIGEIRAERPDVIFLAEAFTRPKIMYRLAKGGFNQSYTYFAWRNDKQGLTDYMTELTRTAAYDFFRPNFWPNTPDILNEYLVSGGRPAFMTRLVLAATLTANYGIYGPAFELVEHTPVRPGSEEYLDSEKYQIRHWDLAREDSLADFIARVNQVRRENPALHDNRSLRFHGIDNPQLIAYSKASADGRNIVLCIVNLDPHATQSGWTALDLGELDIEWDADYQVRDLLGSAHYTWNGPHNYVMLNPHVAPAHIFQIRRRMRSEQDFEYFV